MGDRRYHNDLLRLHVFCHGYQISVYQWCGRLRRSNNGKKICLLCRLVYGSDLLSHNNLGACMGLRPVYLRNLWFFHYRRRMYDNRLPLSDFKLYNECFVSCTGRKISGKHYGYQTDSPLLNGSCRNICRASQRYDDV